MNYTSPAEHHQALLEAVSGPDESLLILCVLCELYNQPFDLKYEPKKKGWTFRIGGVQPMSDNKLIYFQNLTITLSFAHRLLGEILAGGSGAVGE